jgi:trehalose 6-phosphate synthase
MTCICLGIEVPELERETVRKQMMEEFSCVPVFLDDRLADAYYNGFSNR